MIACKKCGYDPPGPGRCSAAGCPGFGSRKYEMPPLSEDNCWKWPAPEPEKKLGPIAAIERWFHEQPQGEDHDADESSPSTVDQCTYCGTIELDGIYIRRDGDTVQICQACWDREYSKKAL